MAHLQNCEYKKVPVVETGEDVKTLTEEPTYGYGVRHVQTFIFFTTLLVGYLARAHLGVSIVAMTYYVPPVINITHVRLTNETFYLERKPINVTYDHIINENETLTLQDDISRSEEDILEEMERVTSDENGIFKKYNWSKPIQEMILASFYLGYCVMQYLMSMVAQRWGGKFPLQIGLFVNGITSIATPWFAYWGGWKAVCACRILQGISQGGFFSSIATLLAQWVPPTELARLTSFVYTGTAIGNIIAFQIGGILSTSPWGWPSIFWGTGILCFLDFLVLTVFGAATPHEHKSISEAERKYITHTMNNVSKKKPRVPLKAALSSKHTWATFSTHVGSSVAFLFMLMQVPSYIHYSMGVNVKDSGLYSSLPHMASFFAAIFYGILSDYLTNKNILSIKNARRSFNTLASVGISLCLVSVSYTKDVSLAVGLLVIAQTSFIAIHVGWMVNYIDLTSNFSGAILAIGNTIMNVFTLTLPILVSFIVVDVTNQTQWRTMFYLVAGLTLFTNAVFVLFMSSDRQPWDEPEYKKTDCEETAMEKPKN